MDNYEDLENELKILEMIESLPVPPEVFSSTTLYDESGMVKVPKDVYDYLESINVIPNTNCDGQLHIDDYMALLKANHILPDIPAISFVECEENEG
jgi:hypothetical protein